VISKLSRFAAILIALAGLAFPADWRYCGADPGHSRYSQLREINTSNANRLKPAWTCGARTRVSFAGSKPCVGMSADAARKSATQECVRHN
jgi:hypothetical protein